MATPSHRLRRHIEQNGSPPELLERCAKALLRCERYKDDVRYLRVWLLHVISRLWRRACHDNACATGGQQLDAE